MVELPDEQCSGSVGRERVGVVTLWTASFQASSFRMLHLLPWLVMKVQMVYSV